MDIRIGSAIATIEERAAIDSLLGPPTTRWEGGERNADVDGHVAYGGHAARAKRHLLLPALHALNDRIGWISKGGLSYVCERLTIPPADAYGVASFYHMFSLEPRPRTVVSVCDDIACLCSGAEQLFGDVEQALDVSRAAVVRSPCVGLCDRAPAVLIDESGEAPGHVSLAPATLAEISQRLASKDRTTNHFWGARQNAEELRLLKCLSRTPESWRKRVATGSRDALHRALELGPERVIDEVTKSRLMGRGGAAFPTGRKWGAVASEAVRPHFAVCNADESEPGTFKDLFLMAVDPQSIVEALTIAGYAGGCERGFVYVRGEYANAVDGLTMAIAVARQNALLGKNILGSGFDFDIEIRRGAGAYICGEETALFNSIEGYRGEPRNKPPFPAQKGLFGKPTIVNNVETLANIPGIILEGGEAYTKIGTPESTGTRLFCLSGCVAKPGVYEVPFGVTLRSLIDMAGGVLGGKKLQAVLLGGAAGTFLTPDEIDVELSFEGVRKIKATLGSGVVMLFDETIDLRKIVARIARFFREESCGQCVPCRVGTQRQEELLHRLAHGKPNGSLATERTLLGEIGTVMRDASICGLGQTASSAVESALAKFDLFGGYRTA